jgi:hypothetical protein
VRSTSLLSPPARRPFTERVSPVASLFPVAGRSGWPAWSVAVGYVIGLAATSAAALLRQPGVPATKTIWAEDGRIFYAQTATLSFWRTLTTLHNGYMQLFPRLAVQLVHFVPVTDVSTLFALVGAVSMGAICCLVFHMARGHIAAPGLRALLAAGMVLLPVANVELLDNLVNVPWWLFFAAFWALLWRPKSWPGRACAALVCFMAAGSEALVALFLPLAVARAGTVREAKEQAATGGLVLGLLYQAVVILPSGAKVTSPGGFHDVGASFAIRVGSGIFGGVRGTDWLVAHARDASIVLGIVAVVAIVLTGVCARSVRIRWFTLVAASYSVVGFVVPVWLRDVATVMDVGTVRIAGRYQAVPLLLLMSAVLVLADYFTRDGVSVSLGFSTWAARPSPATPTRAPAMSMSAVVATAVCAALFLPSWVADFRGPNQRSAGPTWTAQVARAVDHCRRGGNATASLSIDPPYWTVVLPCPLLVAAGSR